LFVVHIRPFIFCSILTGGVGQKLSNLQEKREYVLNAKASNSEDNPLWQNDLVLVGPRVRSTTTF
jgi:hypothetical protein